MGKIVSFGNFAFPPAFFAFGNVAFGVIAFGNVAIGLIAIGNCTIGLFTMGTLSLAAIAGGGVISLGYIGIVGVNGLHTVDCTNYYVNCLPQLSPWLGFVGVGISALLGLILFKISNSPIDRDSNGKWFMNPIWDERKSLVWVLGLSFLMSAAFGSVLTILHGTSVINGLPHNLTATVDESEWYY